MFDNLTAKLSNSFKSLTGKGKLSESNIKDAIREVRRALLEADVAIEVIKVFLDRVHEKAIGLNVQEGLNPTQSFIKLVESELTDVIGGSNAEINFKTQPPAIILVAGLQGAGKTTSVAKLAKFIKEDKKKKVLVVSADVYRPAAIDQLEVVANQADANFFPSSIDESPEDIVKKAKKFAQENFFDVLIVDTAGRLHIDEDMMSEINILQKRVNPIETLFVVDSMTGQDAAHTAKAFSDVLPLTGVILTKTDGDARGGAALSVKTITGQPIKFMGVGETVDGLEAFHPDRLASRILGMGDILGLIEEAEQTLDKEKAEKVAKKVLKGKGFDLEDFRDQLQQMRNMGGMKALLEKMPGMGQMGSQIQNQVDDKQFVRMEAVINSMTPIERRDPEVINGSRKQRIAAGSGTDVQEVNKVLKQHKQMSKMMKKVGKKGGMQKMMRGISGMMPPGGMPRL